MQQRQTHVIKDMFFIMLPQQDFHGLGVHAVLQVNMLGFGHWTVLFF